MFGTIICNKKELTKEETARYQSIYCGLCRAIKNRYGQMERMSVNYDMTFLTLLLNGLYEAEEGKEAFRCPAHPFREQWAFQNEYIDYAADMTILLAYYKCLDDWKDERKHLHKYFGNHLEKYMQELRSKYPRQTACVAESLSTLEYLEKDWKSIPDEIVNYSGKMLSELFVYREDFWSDALRQFGYELGRFIYLMDAVLDFEHDRKKGTYNPLLVLNQEPKEMESVLMQAIGNATAIFEKLPIIQDAGIMRNILYGGVWQKYDMKVRGKEEEHGN